MRIYQTLLILIILFFTSTAYATEAITALKAAYPNLARLHQNYPNYHTQLTTYANQQNFTNPIENLATVIHELIHIDSYIHQGYNINSTYYEPYLSPSAWPSLNNKDLTAHLSAADNSHIGVIHTGYLLNTPKNTLANVLDEINAYTQTIPFICSNAPQQSARHLQALAGHLALADAYLRILAQAYPHQYQQLATNHKARGALETIVSNAYITLNQCYRQGIPDANPRPIPKTATNKFAGQPQP